MSLPQRRYFSIPILLSVILWAARSQAADPSLIWRTIKTPHFYVHYYKSSRHDEIRVARQVAWAAEAAHAKLTAILGYAPSSRTHIVVSDETDGANGSAQILPMNIIRVYVTGPGSLSTLSDYDNWIYGLIMHEYTHILHIDNIHGVARIVNAVLGKTWAPNMIQPKWFVEGLAVYFESEHTSGGRNRSSIYDMYMRMAVLEGKLLEMDQITSRTRHYPRGDVPYLYGSRFIKYIADRFGEEKLASISNFYGGTTVPYGINRVAKSILGHTYVDLYEDFKRYLERRYALQKAAVDKRGRTPFRKLTDYGETCASPRLTSDGRLLVFVDTDGRSHTAIKVMDLGTHDLVEQFDSYGGSGVDFSPDGEHLVYGQSNRWQTFYDYQDLFVRHRRSGKVRQLTDGLRARDPAVSPDGRQVAFVTNELGNMSLAVIPFGGGEHRVLFKGEMGDQVFSPRWSPDGRALVYSRWRSGGERDIYLLDVQTGTTRRLTADRALDTDPVFSSDGQRIYFASDRTGIFNIFCHDVKTGRLWQVSNVLGGALVPAVSPDEKTLYYVGYSSKGYDLHAMDIGETNRLPALPHISDRPRQDQISTSETFPESSYNPLPTIYPRAWTLTFGSDAYGSTVGFELSGGDVVGRHRYTAISNFSTSKGHASYSLAYAYNRFWPVLQLNTSRFEGPRGGVVIDGEKRNYIEENYGFGCSLRLPLLRVPNHSGDVSVGYQVNWLRDADETSVFVVPGEVSPQLPEVGILAGATLGLTYRSVQRFPLSISNEKGRVVHVGLRMDHPSLGSDFKSTQATYSWTEYVDLPWFDDHVLALRLAGGIAGGDLRRRGVFFIGGFPEQDILRSFFESTRIGGTYLRGYPPGALFGEQYHMLNAEYRMPLFNIEKGISTLPLYFNHVHLAAFVDTGNAFYGDPHLEDFKVGVGAELLLETVIGYYLSSTFRVGYARGLMEEGGNEFHFLLGNTF